MGEKSFSSSMFNPLFYKIQKKLAGWKSKLLSYGGNIILIKHILNTMPIHLMSVLKLPKGVFKRLQLIFSNFLWGLILDSKRKKWVSWSKICLLVEEGSLGIWDLSEVLCGLISS
ncbi:hypothetical protein I3842_06G053300 [Carya illinoinensis]|uniref:Uncharacterized protein n=1 Tax=Carya illinoinensis TaxID=32201 RepID=A0A922ES67_CARIL|nr:hypothetical protein I3842_06G053300 [Carya illinoinensis]